MELLEACNGGVSQIGLLPCDGLDNMNLIGKIVCYNSKKVCRALSLRHTFCGLRVVVLFI